MTLICPSCGSKNIEMVGVNRVNPDGNIGVVLRCKDCLYNNLYDSSEQSET